MKTLLTINGAPVHIESCGSQEHVVWTGAFTIDADGSPRAYGPPGTESLDYLGHAGRPGRWFGIATDNQQPDGNPIIQGESDPCPGYYVSTTAYLVEGFYYSDPRHYLDSEKVIYAVVPGNVLRAVEGMCKGSLARITDLKKGLATWCVIGDVGPPNHLGEGSIAAAEFFELNPSAKHGGSPDATRFSWEMWPGLAADGYNLQAG